MRQPAQEFVAAVMVDDRLGDHGTQPGHAPAEPGGHPAVMQGQIGAAGPFRHGSLRERNRNETIGGHGLQCQSCQLFPLRQIAGFNQEIHFILELGDQKQSLDDGPQIPV